MANNGGQLTYKNKFLFDVVDNMLLNKVKFMQGDLHYGGHIEGFSTWSVRPGTEKLIFGTFKIIDQGTICKDESWFRVECKVNDYLGIEWGGYSRHIPHPSDTFQIVRYHKSNTEQLFDQCNPFKKKSR